MRQRLDEHLVALGCYATRSRARDAILRGTVSINGVIAQKPGQTVLDDAKISLNDPAQAYASRAALKLLHALDHFGLSPQGAEALDIGASTGGFTQVLLERGVSHVTAIDVGHGQMDPRIRDDPRVRVVEGLNARELEAAHLDRQPSFITCDVSFISAELALQPALRLAKPGAKAIVLVKPQFELGPRALDRHGIVKDPESQKKACRKIAQWLAREGWIVTGETPSSLPGGDGNREFLIAAEKPC